jgi:hypothetical protein
MEKEAFYKITDKRFENDVCCKNSNRVMMRYLYGSGWIADPSSSDKKVYPDAAHCCEYEDISAEEAAAVIEKEELHLQDLLKTAEELAGKAHEGQKDKGGNPYIGHIKRVAANVKGTREKTVACLHDVVEDTAFTMEDLKKIFPEQILYHVDMLTHKDGDSYSEYLERIFGDPVARRVKMSDLRDNADLTRIPVPDLIDLTRADKYICAQAYLLSGNKEFLEKIDRIEKRISAQKKKKMTEKGQLHQC